MATLREFLPDAKVTALCARRGMLSGGALRHGDLPALLGHAFSPDDPEHSCVRAFRRVYGPRVAVEWCQTAVLLANALCHVPLIGRRACRNWFVPGDTFLKSQAMRLMGVESGVSGAVRGTKQEGACYMWLSPGYTSLLSDDGNVLVFSFRAETPGEDGALRSSGNTSVLRATKGTVRCGGRLPAAEMVACGLCREEDKDHLGDFGYIFVGNAAVEEDDAEQRLWKLTMKIEGVKGYQREALQPFLASLADGDRRRAK